MNLRIPAHNNSMNLHEKEEDMQKGKASISFERPPILLAAASIVGEKEGDGPLARCFDRIEPDPMFGKKSWEEAESELQRQTAEHGLCVAHTACTHEQHVERLLICQRHKLGKLLHGAKYDGKLSHGKSS